MYVNIFLMIFSAFSDVVAVVRKCSIAFKPAYC